MSIGVVLVAAGSGVRLGSGGPKALVELDDRPLVWHAARGLRDAGLPAPVVVHTPGERDRFVDALQDIEVAAYVPGGDDRTTSVRAGVEALADDVDVVAVHDAARPLTPPAVSRAVVDAVTTGIVAVAPARPVADTLKRTVHGEVVATVDRTGLVGVQTPQAFPRQVLEVALASGDGATDDLALVELLVDRGALTGKVMVVAGSLYGHKVTYPDDLDLVRALHAAAAAS